MSSGDSSSRRTFIGRSLLGLLGAGTLIDGCASSPGGLGPPPGGGGGGNSLAAELLGGQLRLEAIQFELSIAGNPAGADLAAWLDRVNALMATAHAKAKTVGEGELRINVAPEMEPAMNELDARGIPLSFTGDAPSYSLADLRQAVARTDTNLATRGPFDQRTLWTFLAMLMILRPDLSDAQAIAVARRARRDDNRDASGDIRDWIDLGVWIPGEIDATAVVAVLLTYQALAPDAAGELGMLLGPLLLAVLFIVLVVDELT